MAKYKNSLKVYVKFALILFVVFVVPKLLLSTWGEEYEKRCGIVEYHYYTGVSSGKHYSKCYRSLKLKGDDAVYGHYTKYRRTYRRTMMEVDRIDKGDTICIYFKKGDICHYQVIPEDPSRLYPGTLHKEKIEDSNIINIAGIEVNGKYILDPKDRKYYNSAYYWLVWLYQGILYISFTALIVGIIALIALKFFKNGKQKDN